MKRLFKLLVFCIIVCTAYVNVSANEKITTISEIDCILNLQEKSNESLEEMGLDQQQIQSIKSIDLIQLFVARSKMDQNTLKNLGYTSNEIKQMRALASKEDLSIHDLKLYSASATVSISTTSATVSSTRYIVNYNYSWNVAPLILSNDIIAVTWQAINNNSEFIGVTLDTSQSTNITHYVSSVDHSSYNTIRRFTVNSAYYGASSSFPIKNMQNETMYWGKSGYGKLIFNISGNGSINEMAIKIAYGHSTLYISPSVTFSVPPGLSITFTSGTTLSDYDYVIYRTNGTIIHY